MQAEHLIVAGHGQREPDEQHCASSHARQAGIGANSSVLEDQPQGKLNQFMSADMSGGTLCSVCQVSRPAEAFSKKQLKAKAHARTCLACAGLSKETGAPGIRIGDAVLLHSLQAVEYNGLTGTVTAALNGVYSYLNVHVCLRVCVCACVWVRVCCVCCSSVCFMLSACFVHPCS